MLSCFLSSGCEDYSLESSSLRWMIYCPDLMFTLLLLTKPEAYFAQRHTNTHTHSLTCSYRGIPKLRSGCHRRYHVRPSELQLFSLALRVGWYKISTRFLTECTPIFSMLFFSKVDRGFFFKLTYLSRTTTRLPGPPKEASVFSHRAGAPRKPHVGRRCSTHQIFTVASRFFKHFCVVFCGAPLPISPNSRLPVQLSCKLCSQPIKLHLNGADIVVVFLHFNDTTVFCL